MRLAALALLACALPAHADELLDSILKRLSEPRVVRAQFVQERFIADITRPIESRGRITVSQKHGVLWQIDWPVKMALAFTPDQIIETGADGVRRLRAQGRNAETQIGRIMRAILASDAETLRAGFDAVAAGGAERWTIRLTPRPREMARVLKEIRLAGGRHLQTIEVEEASGNQTTMRMRQVAIADKLEPEELEYFKAP